MQTVSMPPRIAALPRDKRGYPIPWNVARDKNNEPLFVMNDDRRQIQAIEQRLCSICGEKLGKWLWLIGGPRCAFDPHGAYLDPPQHKECARFALVVCPYLAAPKYLKQTTAESMLGKIDAPIAEIHTMYPGRPVLFVAIASSGYEVHMTDSVVPVLEPIKPYSHYEFWRYGKLLTEAEAMPDLKSIMGNDWQLPACQT